MKSNVRPLEFRGGPQPMKKGFRATVRRGLNELNELNARNEFDLIPAKNPRD